MTSAELIKNVARAALTVAAIAVLPRQVRKPMWWPGRFFARVMNATHAGLTRWGLSHVTIGENSTILDVGCGGGRTIRTLAEMASAGKVCGIDYSNASVAVARSTNARAIEAGRVDIRQGTVSQLPYADATFDVVTAVETHYYWPDLVNDLREVRRVLKPGGTFAIIAEAYKGGKFDAVSGLTMKVMLSAKYLSVDEHRQLFEAAGFADVATFEERGKGWLCVIGKKSV